MGSVVWCGLPGGNGQCRWLAADISHLPHQAPLHIRPIPNLVKYPQVARLGILGTSAIASNPLSRAQAMPEVGGWIPRRYCGILLC